ncbi:DUF7692 domain-containing protein [Halostella salina]|uniref:DUF7692 domain-containing protein n=1 Tax=Halostella salina TaxID=1547897 RepID=UPI000EF79AFE|nr:hypothetical protein [Halostella salina]
MRIRTDGDYSHRKLTIEDAADIWDCNKTEAVMRSCEFSEAMIRNLQAALQHEDMTDELAEVLSTPHVELTREVKTSVDVD